MKVMVKDRMVIKTADFERTCTAPEELQLEINKLVSKTPKGRSFVRYIGYSHSNYGHHYFIEYNRPSGTEDVVRVCAEAATQVRCLLTCICLL